MKGSHDAGSLRFSEEKKSVPLVKASIAGAGKRAWFLIDGRKYSPVYYDLPGTFGMNPASRDFLVRNAVAAGAEVIRFGIGMDQFWQEEGRFDFSGLDRAMEVAYPECAGDARDSDRQMRDAVLVDEEKSG